jgi:hypothetical protein
MLMTIHIATLSLATNQRGNDCQPGIGAAHINTAGAENKIVRMLSALRLTSYSLSRITDNGLCQPAVSNL